jgi:4-hydroxy-tetrahydrodipicolinate synthase
MPLMRACFTETNPIPLKHGLALLGLCRDELRLPLVPMTDPGRRAGLAAALRELGLLA